jgi:hypothetical protein
MRVAIVVALTVAYVLAGSRIATGQVTDWLCVEPRNTTNVDDWDNRYPGGAQEIRVYTQKYAHLNLEIGTAGGAYEMGMTSR